MPPAPATYELREPPAPTGLLPRDLPPPWLWGVLAVAVLLGAAAVWWLLRRRAPAAPGSPAAGAYQEARRALSAISAATPRAAAVQASLILRRYLAVAAGDPALFETHEEFISRADSLARLTPEARAVCHAGFTTLAGLKYSPAESAEPPAGIAGGSLRLLETLHRGLRD